MDAQPLNALHEERTELRSRLAHAWELREPLEEIQRIEDQIRGIWEQIEDLEASAAPAD